MASNGLGRRWIFALIGLVAVAAFRSPVKSFFRRQTTMSVGHVADRTPEWDLWVVGAGTLGGRVARKFLEQHPTARVVVEATSEKRRGVFEDLKVNFRVRNQRGQADSGSARNVVLCFPPSACANFEDEIRLGSKLWSGDRAAGQLVYTSSIGCYGEAIGQVVTELTSVDPSPSPYTSSLIAAEQTVLSSNGRVLRLAGLYTAERGAHAHYLKKSAAGQPIEADPADVINLIHYDDAADLTLRILDVGDAVGDSMFLGVDDEPTSRADMCRLAVESALFPGAVMPKFVPPPSRGPSKRCNNRHTRSVLGWVPRHTTFCQHMLALRPHRGYGSSLPTV